jgi:membrane dipeptidase
MISRRKFIQQSATTVAAASIGVSAFGKQNQVNNFVTFDLHSHPGMFIAKGSDLYKGDEFVSKTISEMNSGGLTGALFSLVADGPLIKATATGIVSTGDYGPGDGWKEYKRQLKTFNDLIKQWPVTPALKVADLAKAKESGKVAAFIATEGGDFIQGDHGRLDEMYNDGVRSIQIVHYHQNELGDLQTEPSKFNGLSMTGVAVVRKMNKLKMLIDVAHAAEQTVQRVVDTTDAPIILSHSVLRIDMDRPLAKRTITPEHAKLISKTGGIIGAWPSGYSKDFDEFMDGVRRLVDVVGVDHVGLGTDLDGNFKPVLDSYAKLPQYIEALRKRGFSEDEVKKIAGGNMQRVLERVVG